MTDNFQATTPVLHANASSDPILLEGRWHGSSQASDKLCFDFLYFWHLQTPSCKKAST